MFDYDADGADDINDDLFPGATSGDSNNNGPLMMTSCVEYIANVTAVIQSALRADPASAAVVAAARPRPDVSISASNNSASYLVNSSTAVVVVTTSGLSATVWINWLIGSLLVPCVCVFGAVGNALNLVVLTRRRLRRSMDGLERSVRLGLVARRPSTCRSPTCCSTRLYIG